MKKIHVIICMITLAASTLMPNEFTTNNSSKLFLYEALPEEQGDSVVMEELEATGDYEAKNALWNEIDEMAEKIDENARVQEIADQFKKNMDTPELDVTAIVVNDYRITKENIENWKIQSGIRVENNVTQMDLQQEIKRDIIKNVRKRIVYLEAERQGLKPEQEEIESFVNEQKELMNQDFRNLNDIYIETYGITEEEYWEGVYDSGYLMIQFSMLYSSVTEMHSDEIKTEAEKRGVPISEVELEYWEAYVDELVSKANIEIVDPEIKALFGIED